MTTGMIPTGSERLTTDHVCANYASTRISYDGTGIEVYMYRIVKCKIFLS